MRTVRSETQLLLTTNRNTVIHEVVLNSETPERRQGQPMTRWKDTQKTRRRHVSEHIRGDISY